MILVKGADANGGLFVADLDAAPNEKIKQLAVRPKLSQAQLQPFTRRLDTYGQRTMRSVGECASWDGLEVTEAILRSKFSFDFLL